MLFAAGTLVAHGTVSFKLCAVKEKAGGERCSLHRPLGIVSTWALDYGCSKNRPLSGVMPSHLRSEPGGAVTESTFTS